MFSAAVSAAGGVLKRVPANAVAGPAAAASSLLPPSPAVAAPPPADYSGRTFYASDLVVEDAAGARWDCQWVWLPLGAGQGAGGGGLPAKEARRVDAAVGAALRRSSSCAAATAAAAAAAAARVGEPPAVLTFGAMTQAHGLTGPGWRSMLRAWRVRERVELEQQAAAAAAAVKAENGNGGATEKQPPPPPPPPKKPRSVWAILQFDPGASPESAAAAGPPLLRVSFVFSDGVPLGLRTDDYLEAVGAAALRRAAVAAAASASASALAAPPQQQQQQEEQQPKESAAAAAPFGLGGASSAAAAGSA